jgi:phage shock protein A
MDEVSRVIGALEAGQEAQERQHTALAAKVDSMDTKLDLLLANQEAERAKRRVWKMIGTGGASVAGALAAMAVQWFSSKPP